jgi:hypothetical protein
MVCRAHSIKGLLTRFRTRVKAYLKAAEGSPFVTDADKPPDSNV